MENNDRIVKEGAALLSALANPRRLQVMILLAEHTELSVREMADRIDISQSALSQHLSKLRHAKLVSTRRDAQSIYYSIKHDCVPKLLNCLRDIYR
ncbi:metalloregulator ArsR/SmtB family transcription factor [Rhizobium pusense]|uniref:Winged helix-turn-helix transcriptional regulator n=1 Tax=Agrobacterium pusense TaxID=648995 RepID=A0A6H0ZG26_9HYPH|nr:metalloregulator ArsR/SmtB family transcription factor [Agrobacterium pusense]MDH0872662.1 metalloregulator ArsR/SmtB family transcription factor [Agrobacterium pusense]MDH1271615.1 metalloregulator ArsR/SmtB family transcription factor [Agrobacterium pusense]MDH2092600.1 metalloregulator ArsR/SmtB family transcription factor [Agrobacterium pusense]QIX19786.1 winged helix-turn-helix transcriptional regulator [Agrobacterium pusense]WCK27566.1 metalloregulator ArsR/SmtB family transcription f